MKRPGKILPLLMDIIFLFTSCASSTTPVKDNAPIAENATKTGKIPTAEGFKTALPAVGDELHGFTVREIIPMEVLGATGVLFEHKQSGATLLYLASEDTNCSFDISFRTPALDDKGIPHVLEHITLGGSEKYPDPNITFPFFNRVYSTYANALTFSGMTSYPVASLSEKQLMSMMDFYMSCVFTPLLYSEPKLVEREAWRYELANENDDINIAGTVYSEMQGALTLDEFAGNNEVKTLYPGSTTAHVSGGVPEDVRTLTYDDLIQYHDTYYHPSNSLITLYGKLDLDSFLFYIDSEYLSRYDAKKIDVDFGKTDPLTKTAYATYEFPVESGANTKNASVISYSFALNGADAETTRSVSLISDILSQQSSCLMQALNKKLSNASVSVFINYDSPSCPYLSVTASNINESDRDTLVATVDEALAAMTAESISESVLDSVVSAQKRKLMETPDDQDLGVDASCNIALEWTYFGDVLFYNTYRDTLNNMTVERADKLLKTYLTDNIHRAVTVTKPVQGLSEENTGKLRTELAELKASMSPENLKNMVEHGKEYSKWSAKPVSDEILSKLLNMTVSDLPEEISQYDIHEKAVDGVRYLSAESDVKGISNETIFLDGSRIPIDKLQDVMLYLSFLGMLDTESHSKEELSTMIDRYMSDLITELYAAENYQDAGNMYAIRLSWTSLGEDAQSTVDLLREMLYDTRFTDMETIKGILSRLYADFQMLLDNFPDLVQTNRLDAMEYDTAAYLEYTRNYAFHAYLRDMIVLADSDPSAFSGRMEQARDIVNNRLYAIVCSAGDSETIAAYEKLIPALLSDMDNVGRDKVDYTPLIIKRQNEGLVINSTVQMNRIQDVCTDYSGKNVVIDGLVTDQFMLPTLRNSLGAYGARAVSNQFFKGLTTFRDPNLAKSYQFFETLPEYLRTVALDQNTVDTYIIGNYTYLSRPRGVLSGAVEAMINQLRGLTVDMRLQYLRDAKATTVEDVRQAADMYEAMLKNGVHSSSGTASALQEAKDLFDVILTVE